MKKSIVKGRRSHATNVIFSQRSASVCVGALEVRSTTAAGSQRDGRSEVCVEQSSACSRLAPYYTVLYVKKNTPTDFQSSVTSHRVRFPHTTDTFSESYRSALSNDTLFGTDTILAVK